jgi:predicted O-linked N-acetylglucosamine transferase (SPINDLY family)
LRVGYVSPDLRRHSVATFFEPLLAHHDKAAVEVTCYSATDRPDDRTARLRGQADRWREVARASDDQVAELIRSDGIDILVDLTGHMAGNRLGVFARRPAPVQVTYVGHPNTTGMNSMGYRLTDPYLDPVGGDSDGRHTERLARLPRVFGCYQPPEEPLDVAPAPLTATGGRVTFGCLNNPAKVTVPVLELWARLLAAVPGSTLVLLGQPHDAAAGAMRAAGVDPNRVRWLGRLRRTDYLRAFGQIDVALDPFPYNGQTTTCDGFWAGVPMVALAGDAYVSRMGGCLLRQVGLEDLIAATPDEYVATAARLAADTDRLVTLRRTLRERLIESAVVRAQPLAADIEAAYRGMWRAWCDVGE